jgi:adenosylmethionine-8-amino-7-oxononanoate aminotransferase
MTRRDEIVTLDKAHVWHPYTPMGPYIDSFDPVVVDRADGPYLYDADGRRLIDGIGSWWVNLLGHNHPRLVGALHRQSERLCHCALAGIAHEGASRLAAELVRRCGSAYERVFYSDDGSTAVEVALRMALQYWQIAGRPQKNRFVTLSGSFHGETVGAASVSGVGVFHAALEPLLFECLRLPSPAEAACDEQWREDVFGRAERLLRERSGEIAAVIVEPLVQGAAGMLMYEPRYLERLGLLLHELGILLIADEVFVGYGRCGTFLASHAASVEPDILCLGKGFTGGLLPMAATVVTSAVFEAFRGGPERTLWYGHSFTGNPLGAAVALEVLAILEQERVIESLGPNCAALQRGLDGIAAHPWVRDCRRTGFIAAFTLVPPGARGGAEYAADAGWRFYAQALARGAWLRPLGNVVYFVLPLTATVGLIDELFGIVRASLEASFGA